MDMSLNDIDEHQACENLMKACEEAYRKREHYKRFGPWFVIVSGIVLLSLMFSQDAKAVFLTLWVITVLYTAGLMIRAEFRLHRYREMLGLPDEDEETGEMTENPTDENEEQPETDGEVMEKQDAVLASGEREGE